MRKFVDLSASSSQRHIHSGVENEVENGNSSTRIGKMDYENTALMYRIGMRF